MRHKPLTFTEGLNFGCGFWVAGFLFFAVALPLGTIFIAIVGTLGLTFLGGLIGS